MQSEPRKEHRWLRRLVGEWTSEFEHPGENGAPPRKLTGTERVRSIGDLWVVGEATSQMPENGASMTSVVTLGYDAETQRFVGTWIGSPMDYLWIYDGELDPSEQLLTLSADGPDFTSPEGGEKASYRDVIEFLSDDHRTLTSHVRGPDGQWQQVMTISFRRKQ